MHRNSNDIYYHISLQNFLLHQAPSPSHPQNILVHQAPSPYQPTEHLRAPSPITMSPTDHARSQFHTQYPCTATGPIIHIEYLIYSDTRRSCLPRNSCHWLHAAACQCNNRNWSWQLSRIESSADERCHRTRTCYSRICRATEPYRIFCYLE